MNLFFPVLLNAASLPQRICSLLLILMLIIGGRISPAAAAATATNKAKNPAAKGAVEAKREEKGTAGAGSSDAQPETFIDVTPEELVEKPQDYLNKNVRFTGKFFAFSSLALDYKPAFRSSKAYLSFLILRSHNHVPLSELKLALPMPKEKDPENTLISVLKDGDTIELSGKVFSTALGDPWVDVRHIKKIAGSSDEKTAQAGQENVDKESESPAPQQKSKPGHDPLKPQK